jgi:tetratricopeptide (TPR) repeat protein
LTSSRPGVEPPLYPREMPASSDSFGSRLKALRVEKGMTQEGLGGGRYSGAYISQLETGRRAPSSSLVAFMAERLEVNEHYLRTGEDPGLRVRLGLEVQRARALIYQDAKRPKKRLERLAAEAGRHGYVDVRVRAVEALALARERNGETQAALDLYQQAERLSLDLPLNERCGAVVGIARCFQQLGDFRYAAHLLEGYLMQLEKEDLSDPTALMRINAALLSVYFATGMIEQAAKAAEEAQRLEVRVTDPEHVACMNLNLTGALLFRGRTDDAMVALKKAEDIFSSLGWKNEVARAAIARGMIHAKADDLATAKESFEEALQLLEDAPHSLDEARARNELARIERLQGDLPAARKHLLRVLTLMKDGEPRVRAFASRELGFAATDRAEAEKRFHHAIDLYRMAGDPIETAITFRALGDVYLRERDIEAMTDAYQAGLDAVEDRDY